MFSQNTSESGDSKRHQLCFVKVFRSFCHSFGESFTLNVVRPLFLATMGMLEGQEKRKPSAAFLSILGRNENSIPNETLRCEWWQAASTAARKAAVLSDTSLMGPNRVHNQSGGEIEIREKDLLLERILPVYTRAVLVELPHVYIKRFIADTLVGVALENNGWRSRQYPVVEKVFMDLSSDSATAQQLLSVLSDIAAHPSTAVRVKVTLLLAVVAPVVSDKDQETKVMPSLHILCRDKDTEVRKSSVKAVIVLTMSYDSNEPYKPMKPKLKEELLRLTQDPSHKVVIDVLRNLGRYIPTCSEQMKDEFIASLVAKICQRVDAEANAKTLWHPEQLEEVAIALLNNCQALTSTGLSDIGWDHLGPSLGVLLRTGKDLLDPIYIDMLRMMLPNGFENRSPKKRQPPTIKPRPKSFFIPEKSKKSSTAVTSLVAQARKLNSEAEDEIIDGMQIKYKT